jgi:outer membrane protein OmpA-like peptidoglycan-associated protein
MIVFLLTVTTGFSSACVATRKFVRNDVDTKVKASSDALGARIDTNAGEIKETRDSVDRVNQRVTGVDGRVTDLDTKTAQGMNTLKSDVQSVDQKAGQATNIATRAAGDLVTLDQKFQNRNQFSVVTEKNVQFKFDSASMDASFKATLDEIAAAVMQNANAIVVLEGRTDSTGNTDYNIRLGERRVEAVRHYLAVEKDVPVYRIHNISFGPAKPIAPNDSRDGREKNRAVTVSVLLPTADGSVASKTN